MKLLRSTTLIICVSFAQAFTVKSVWGTSSNKYARTDVKAIKINDVDDIMNMKMPADQWEKLLTTPMTDPNPPSTSAEKELRQRISQLLEKGWSSSDGFVVSKDEFNGLNDMMGVEDKKESLPATYGEISELGSRQLFHHMGLNSSNKSKDHDDLTLIDLGCGNGKLLVQAYMELPNVRHARGIELSNTRYKSAIQAWDNIKTDARDLRMLKSSEVNVDNPDAFTEGTVDILEGDLYEMDVSSATHIYASSLCFTDDMMRKLAQKLVDEGDKLKVVATIKSFPKEFHEQFGPPRIEFFQMSWTEKSGCIVHLYELEKC